MADDRIPLDLVERIAKAIGAMREGTIPPEQLGYYLAYDETTVSLTANQIATLVNADPQRVLIDMYNLTGGAISVGTKLSFNGNPGIPLPGSGVPQSYDVGKYGTFPQQTFLAFTTVISQAVTVVTLTYKDQTGKGVR